MLETVLFYWGLLQGVFLLIVSLELGSHYLRRRVWPPVWIGMCLGGLWLDFGEFMVLWLAPPYRLLPPAMLIVKYALGTAAWTGLIVHVRVEVYLTK